MGSKTDIEPIILQVYKGKIDIRDWNKVTVFLADIIT